MLLVAVIAILVEMSALGIRLRYDAPPAQRRPVYERAARAPEPQSGRATPSITVPELSHDAAGNADYADDDYATGYDDGYEQGEEDAAYGSYGDGYDDNHGGGSHYSSGYDDGYEDGFNDY